MGMASGGVWNLIVARCVVIPMLVHVAACLILEGDVCSKTILGFTFIASFLIGGLIARKGLGPIEAAAGAAWFPVLAAWGRWYWLADMPSPLGAVSLILEGHGWREMPALAALGLIQAAGGAGGYAFFLFGRWFERTTGRPLFDKD